MMETMMQTMMQMRRQSLALPFRGVVVLVGDEKRREKERHQL